MVRTHTKQKSLLNITLIIQGPDTTETFCAFVLFIWQHQKAEIKSHNLITHNLKLYLPVF